MQRKIKVLEVSQKKWTKLKIGFLKLYFNTSQKIFCYYYLLCYEKY